MILLINKLGGIKMKKMILALVAISLVISLGLASIGTVSAVSETTNNTHYKAFFAVKFFYYSNQTASMKMYRAVQNIGYLPIRLESVKYYDLHKHPEYKNYARKTYGVTKYPTITVILVMGYNGHYSPTRIYWNITEIHGLDDLSAKIQTSRM
jgi:hypothetical protein